MKEKARRSLNAHYQTGGGFLDVVKGFAGSDFAKDAAKAVANKGIDLISKKISGKGKYDGLLGAKRGSGKKKYRR